MEISNSWPCTKRLRRFERRTESPYRSDRVQHSTKSHPSFVPQGLVSGRLNRYRNERFLSAAGPNVAERAKGASSRFSSFPRQLFNMIGLRKQHIVPCLASAYRISCRIDFDCPSKSLWDRHPQI